MYSITMDKEKRDVRKTIRLSETLHDALQTLAKADRNRPLGTYIYNALEDHVVQHFGKLPRKLQKRLSQDPDIAEAISRDES